MPIVHLLSVLQDAHVSHVGALRMLGGTLLHHISDQTDRGIDISSMAGRQPGKTKQHSVVKRQELPN